MKVFEMPGSKNDGVRDGFLKFITKKSPDGRIVGDFLLKLYNMIPLEVCIWQ